MDYAQEQYRVRCKRKMYRGENNAGRNCKGNQYMMEALGYDVELTYVKREE